MRSLSILTEKKIDIDREKARRIFRGNSAIVGMFLIFFLSASFSPIAIARGFFWPFIAFEILLIIITIAIIYFVEIQTPMRSIFGLWRRLQDKSPEIVIHEQGIKIYGYPTVSWASVDEITVENLGVWNYFQSFLRMLFGGKKATRKRIRIFIDNFAEFKKQNSFWKRILLNSHNLDNNRGFIDVPFATYLPENAEEILEEQAEKYR